MPIFRTLLLTLLTGLLAACASPEKAVPPTASPSNSVGYIGGNFVVGKPTFTSAFVLVNKATSAEYVLSFSSGSGIKAGHKETSLIALPPGTYQATHWIVYNSYWGVDAGSREIKKQLQPGLLTEPFTVKGNEVVFLGKFYSEWGFTGYSTFSGYFKAEPISNKEARDALNVAYPNFSSVGFICIACRP